MYRNRYYYYHAGGRLFLEARTGLLQPPEHRLGRLAQAAEAEAVSQVSTEQAQGRVLRGLTQVLPELIQPQSDHSAQSAGEEISMTNPGIHTQVYCSENKDVFVENRAAVVKKA